MPYKDMAHNCEVLLAGKWNMSRLMTTQQKQEYFLDLDLKNIDTSSDVDVGSQKVIP